MNRKSRKASANNVKPNSVPSPEAQNELVAPDPEAVARQQEIVAAQSETDEDYATIIEPDGTRWNFRIGFQTLRKVCAELGVSVADLTMMNVQLDQVLGCLHFACAKQIKNREITIDEFYERIDAIPPEDVMDAARQALVRAFPTLKDQLSVRTVGGGQKKNPFDLGNGETSSTSA